MFAKSYLFSGFLKSIPNSRISCLIWFKKGAFSCLCFSFIFYFFYFFFNFFFIVVLDNFLIIRKKFMKIKLGEGFIFVLIVHK